jgi:hypothetical protein
LQEDTQRQHSQRDQILFLLEARGSVGVTNRELNEVGYRYGARLWELKKEGYLIRTDALGGGFYKFTLLNGAASAALPVPPPADKSPSQKRDTLPLFAGVRE